MTWVGGGEDYRIIEFIGKEVSLREKDKQNDGNEDYVQINTSVERLKGSQTPISRVFSYNDIWAWTVCPGVPGC